MGAALAGLAEVGLAAGEIGATAGEVGATAGEIGATAGEIGTTAGEIGTTAGEIGTTAGEIGEAGTTAGEIGEAGTTAGEIGEAGTTAGEAGEAGTTAGEAGEAGTTAGKAGGMLSKIGPVFEKINKMVMDYIIIDTVFKGAKKILEGFTSDPAAKARLNKLKKLIPVLSASGKILKAVWDWVKVNSNATTDADAVASLKGEWSKFFPDLQKAAAVLQKLALIVSQKNAAKKPMTDGEVQALEAGLNTVLASFQGLAAFKSQHVGKIPLLAKMPINEKIVSALQAQLLRNKM